MVLWQSSPSSNTDLRVERVRQEKIRTILAVRNDRFGEFLLNIPALRALKETYPQARLIVALDPYVKELTPYIPAIDETLDWKAGRRHSLRERLGMLRLLKEKNIDAAIMLNPSQEFNILTFLAGIPVRVGYDRKWGFLLTHKIKDEKYLGIKHEIEYNLDLVGLIGARTRDLSLSLKIVDPAPLPFKGLDDSDFVIVHPWTSDIVKQWPFEYFQILVRKIIEGCKIKVLIVGGKDNLLKSRQLFSRFGAGLVNLTGQTSLRQLAVLLSKSRLLISQDSGPMHLGCAAGTPVIAIFRSGLAAKSSRRWGPWGKNKLVIEKTSLSDIKVDQVLEVVKLKLAK